MKKKKIFLISIIGSLVITIGLILSTIFVFVPSSKYSKAINHYNNSEYDTAEKIFTDLGNYKDSEEQLKIISAHKSFQEANIENGIEIICSINGEVNVTYDLDDNVTETFTEVLNSENYELYNKQVKVGYNFLNWELLNYSIDNTTENYSATISVKAIWIANTDTRYTVNYYLENYEDTNYTLEETDVLYGETLTIVYPKVKDFEGYISPEEQDVEILPDGSAQLNYYYKRKIITLNFATNGGTSVEDFDTKWGTPLLDLPSTSREGFTFGGWFSNIELTEQYEVFKTSGTLYAYWEEEYKPTNFTYELLEGEYVLLDTSLVTLEKLIPSYIGDCKLVTIAENALSDIRASSLIIPNTVSYIADNAFENSEINELTLPNSINYIGQNAFIGVINLTKVNCNGSILDWCNIVFENELSNPMSIAQKFYCIGENGYEEVAEIIIPNEVNYLGNYQFYGFDYITKVVISDSVLYIGENVFTNCNKITALSAPFIGQSEEDFETSYLGYFFGGTSYATNNLIVPKALNKISITNTYVIDNYSLYDCSMIEVVELNDKLLKIGDYAFANTSINNIIIPNSVVEIGYGAFKYCGLESVTVPFAGYSLENNYTQNGHIGYMFGANSSIENSDYVPNSLKTISMTNTREIDSYAFENCSNIENIILPKTLLRINSYAFDGCTGLQYIFIPSSVEVIEENAFNSCDDLVIYCEAEVPNNNWDINWNSLNKPVYYGVNENTFIEVNDIQYVIVDGKATLANCLNDSNIITIPNTVSFDGVDYDVISIGEEAFYGCNNLEEVIIPESITTIESEAFRDCTNLRDIILPSSLTTIGSYAFENVSLTEIYIPKSVTTIGSYAFNSCDDLVIYCENDISTTEENWNPSNRPVYYGINSENYLELEDVQYVVVNGTATVTNYVGTEEEITIPSVITIGENTYNVIIIKSYAFDGNSSLTKINLPSTITTIESYAFNNCSKLSEIIIPQSVTTINYKAFNNCSNLIIYTYYSQREAREQWGNNWYAGCYYVSYDYSN